ncbi:MAG: FAD:protein FMN transferase [Elusimicrobia bacterium]|nr:FAD:protein FMN transferase [Elusimicrobiota bacterium]
MARPVSEKRTLMGSPFSITAYPGSGRRVLTEEELQAAIATAYQEAARVEDLLTDFRDSPLNRVNAGAGGPPVPVPPELFDLLDFALGLCRDSAGAFDITFASAGMLWREAFRTGVPPSEAALDAALRLVDHSRVELDRNACTVRLPEKGMRIGLGSIGKGYGVDRAFRVLRDLGLENILVDGAGDIRLSSSPAAPRPWRVAIRNPFAADGRPAGFLDLRSGAVVTSGDYERFFVHGGRKYHHVLDARTGRVRDGVASVTVTASTAALANACSISAMALGPEEGEAFLRRRRDAGGVMILTSGRVLNCGLKPGPELERRERCHS